MSRRATAWLAWSVCALTLALIVCAIVLAIKGSDVELVIFPLCLTLSAVVGGLVASRRPGNAVGWFFLGSAGCFALTQVATEYATFGLPGAQAMGWLQSWLWLPGVMLLLCFIPLYFPNGRLVSRRWRWVVGLALFFCVSGAVLSALTPEDIMNAGIVNPLGIEALQPVSDRLEPVFLPLYFTLLFASATSLVVRYRRSGSVERQQIKWLAFAALAIPVWFLTNSPIEAVSRTLFFVMDDLIFSVLIPSRRRGSYSQVPSLRHRCSYQPHACIWLPHRHTGGRLFRRGDGDPGLLPHPHRPRAATPTCNRRLHPGNRRAVQPLEAPYPVVHRPQLLPQEVRRGQDA
jgi:hypothetical protein